MWSSCVGATVLEVGAKRVQFAVCCRTVQSSVRRRLAAVRAESWVPSWATCQVCSGGRNSERRSSDSVEYRSSVGVAVIRPSSVQDCWPADTELTRCRCRVEPRVPDAVADAVADSVVRAPTSDVVVTELRSLSYADKVVEPPSFRRRVDREQSSSSRRGACRRDPRYVPCCLLVFLFAISVAAPSALSRLAFL